MVNKRTLVDERFRNLLRGWDGSYATGVQPGISTPGNRPINGSALKGRKLTWINPTRIAPQNEFRVCLAVFFRGESTKNMDIIFHTADLKRVALGMAFDFGGENDVHQNKRERLRHIKLHHLYMLLLRSILRPFRARRRGWMFPRLKPRAESSSPFGFGA
jgi:hypothetical protein